MPDPQSALAWAGQIVAVLIAILGVARANLGNFDFWLDLAGGLYTAFGYWMVLLGAAFENTALVGWLLPGGTMVLFGGFYARLGRLDFPTVLLLGWLGVFAGNQFDYWLGRLGLYRVLTRFLPADTLNSGLGRAQRFLERWGALALVAAHFVGYTRMFVAISAGVSGVSFRRFLLYDALAAAAWAGIYCSAGYLLATNVGLLEAFYFRFGPAAVIVIALILLVRVVGPRWLSRRARRARESEAAG